MKQAAEIKDNDAQGLVADFINDGKLDIADF